MSPTAVRTLIASPVVILLISATRLLLVSNYNPSTASSIAASGGFTGTLLGTIMPLMPLFLPITFLLLVAARSYALATIIALAALALSPADTTLRVTWTATHDAALEGWDAVWAGEGLDWLGSLNLQLQVLLGLVTVLILGDVYDAFADSTWNSSPGIIFRFIKLTAFLALSAVGIALWCAISGMFMVMAYTAADTLYEIPENLEAYEQPLRRPWLPAEQIGLSSGETEVGYVVATKDGWTLVLRERDRGIRYIKSTAVNTRTVCVPGVVPSFRPPLVRFSESPAPMPACRVTPPPGTRPPPPPVPVVPLTGVSARKPI